MSRGLIVAILLAGCSGRAAEDPIAAASRDTPATAGTTPDHVTTMTSAELEKCVQLAAPVIAEYLREIEDLPINVSIDGAHERQLILHPNHYTTAEIAIILKVTLTTDSGAGVLHQTWIVFCKAGLPIYAEPASFEPMP